jgi:valyl-tRNA synthetase
VKAVEEGRTVFLPEEWTKTYMHWMTNIQDWCISRQLWWGHQIPAWYCGTAAGPPCGARPDGLRAAGHAKLTRDPDVLDTWFSSGLWPFSTLGWPEQTAALKTFYPTSVMETGFDIIFFWVARMMMMGLHFMGEVPFAGAAARDGLRRERAEDVEGEGQRHRPPRPRARRHARRGRRQRRGQALSGDSSAVEGQEEVPRELPQRGQA